MPANAAIDIQRADADLTTLSATRKTDKTPPRKATSSQCAPDGDAVRFNVMEASRMCDSEASAHRTDPVTVS
jgi:hypothetical protein